jgi:pimeloyl-ACP methyl ester carboxylesterase
MMPRVELTVGAVEYEDSGADGPVVVLLHGLVMDGTVWRDVVTELPSECRVIRPTLPFGAHREPMKPDADLSLRGLGRLVAEFLERLELGDVTLCFNDWGGAQVMIADGLTDRVGKLVLAACEAFENYPPGIPGRLASLSAKLPGGVVSMRYALSVRALRQLPIPFGWMSKRGVPDDLMQSWLTPLGDRAIRRDLIKYAGDSRRGRKDMLAATSALASFEKPVLVAWASEDRIMSPAHGPRLADAFANARLVEIADSYTLIPIDQPRVLARHIREFVGAAADVTVS